MAVHLNSDEARILRGMIPLASLPNQYFADICSKISVENVQDAVIFKKGDVNPDLIYLLEGNVVLQAEGLVVEVIRADNESAKFALAHQIPRKIDAVAEGAARIVRMDAEIVNNPPPVVIEDAQQGYTVEESSEDADDWLTALLLLPLFQTLPPGNLQKILITLKTAQYAKGEIIYDAGKELDYFYVISKGECQLSRQLQGDNVEIKLGHGDSFGDEFLLTDSPAQECVIALTDVSLVLVEKRHFLSQIKQPILRFIGHDELPAALNTGRLMLDVRHQQKEQAKNGVDAGLNIPLLCLRQRLVDFPSGTAFVTVCENGVKSTAAAFLLLKRNIDVLVLKDGLGIEIDEEVLSERGQSDGQRQEDGAQEMPKTAQLGEGKPVTVKSNVKSALSDAENEKLNREIQRLKSENSKLLAEKELAENHNKTLNQQLARLKEILQRFSSRK